MEVVWINNVEVLTREPVQVQLSQPEAPAQSDEDSDVPEAFKATFNRNKEKAGSDELCLPQSTTDEEGEERNSPFFSFQPEQVQLTEAAEPAQSDEDSDVPVEFKATFYKKKKKADSDEDWTPPTTTVEEGEKRNPSSEKDSVEELELSDQDETSSSEQVSLQLCSDCGRFYFFFKPHTCVHILKPHPCVMCGRRYPTAEGLKRHSKTHSENPEHRCVYCFATIITQQDKLYHQRVHQDQSQPYQCRHCISSFSSLSQRNKHMFSHRGSAVFKCDVCGMSFSGKSQAERHMVVHTGVKLHQCSVCERGFNQESHLKSHMRLHTGERPYACPHCDRAFNHNVSLKSHVQRYHPSECGDREESSCDGVLKKRGPQESSCDGVLKKRDPQESSETGPGSEPVVKPKKETRPTLRPRGRPKRPGGEKWNNQGFQDKQTVCLSVDV